jgi:predicted CopG family antitoxin
MVKGKTVKVSEETHAKLAVLKIKTRARNLDEVIRRLIEKCGDNLGGEKA